MYVLALELAFFISLSSLVLIVTAIAALCYFHGCTALEWRRYGVSGYQHLVNALRIWIRFPAAADLELPEKPASSSCFVLQLLIVPNR